MKIAKTFTLDQELIEKLVNEENASELINRLLNNYYYDKNFQTQSLEEQLRRAELLENELIQSKENEKKKLDAEIALKIEAKKMIDLELEKELNENILLLDSQPEIAHAMIDAMQKEWSTNTLLEYLEKLRNAGIKKIGTYQLKKYLNAKGVYEQVV